MAANNNSQVENVLIGVPDCEIYSEDTRHLTYTTNKIGGLPNWIKNDQSVITCSKCGKNLLLVIQIYCPLDNSEFHRTLFVFCCGAKTCWSTSGGWRVFREQSPVSGPVTENYKPKETTELKWDDNDDWGVDNDWISTDDHNLSNELKVLNLKSNEFLEPVNMATSQEQWFESQTQEFKSYYINVVDNHKETLNDPYIIELVAKYEIENSDDYSNNFDGKTKFSAEEYEKSDVNKTFHKFWKNVQYCPVQIIRYNLNGEPLWIKTIKNFKTPKCRQCGSQSAFEFQLMPNLLPYLHHNDIDCNIEYGTVLIYTCSKNCFKNDIAEEHIVYQSDPDLLYFKGQNSE